VDYSFYTHGHDKLKVITQTTQTYRTLSWG